ncbi:MAG: hypothetical protein K2X27_14435 [Candidatus Obscuribacterales bacterium]|nr:hypothetical protein [Candidatus Obscuribacterales bacterium]
MKEIIVNFKQASLLAFSIALLTALACEAANRLNEEERKWFYIEAQAKRAVRQKKFLEAEKLYIEALQISEKMKKQDRRAENERDLADLYAELGESSKMRLYLEKCVLTLSRLEGPRTQSLDPPLSKLLEIYESSGEKELLIKTMEQLLEIRELSLGMDEMKPRFLRHRLADIFIAGHELLKAEELISPLLSVENLSPADFMICRALWLEENRLEAGELLLRELIAKSKEKTIKKAYLYSQLAQLLRSERKNPESDQAWQEASALAIDAKAERPELDPLFLPLLNDFLLTGLNDSAKKLCLKAAANRMKSGLDAHDYQAGLGEKFDYLLRAYPAAGRYFIATVINCSKPPSAKKN